MVEHDRFEDERFGGDEFSAMQEERRLEQRFDRDVQRGRDFDLQRTGTGTAAQTTPEFRRELATENIQEQLEDQFDRSLEPGRDFEVVQTNDGGFRAELTDSFRRQIQRERRQQARSEARQDLKSQLEDELGRDLTPGEDFTVQETDEGFTAELTPSLQADLGAEAFADTAEDRLAAQAIEQELEQEVGDDVMRGRDFMLQETDDGFVAELTPRFQQRYGAQLDEVSFESDVTPSLERDRDFTVNVTDEGVTGQLTESFQQQFAEQRVASQLASETGRDVTPGEDFRLVDGDGGFRAELTTGFERDLAEEDIEGRLERRLGVDVEPGQDFTLRPTGDGYRAVLGSGVAAGLQAVGREEAMQGLTFDLPGDRTQDIEPVEREGFAPERPTRGDVVPGVIEAEDILEQRLEAQAGRDLERGEDFTIDRDGGELVASLSPGAEREIATEQLQGQLESEFGDGFEPGEDFTVVETDDGFGAEFTQSGEIKAQTGPLTGAVAQFEDWTGIDVPGEGPIAGTGSVPIQSDIPVFIRTDFSPSDDASLPPSQRGPGEDPIEFETGIGNVVSTTRQQIDASPIPGDIGEAVAVGFTSDAPVTRTAAEELGGAVLGDVGEGIATTAATDFLALDETIDPVVSREARAAAGEAIFEPLGGGTLGDIGAETFRAGGEVSDETAAFVGREAIGGQIRGGARTPVTLGGVAATAPINIAEFGRAGAEATARGEGSEFITSTGQAAATAGAVTAAQAVDEPFEFAGEVGASLPVSAALIRAGGRPAAFAIQPGEELAITAARRGLLSTGTATVVPGVRAGMVEGSQRARSIIERTEIEPRMGVGPVPPRIRFESETRTETEPDEIGADDLAVGVDPGGPPMTPGERGLIETSRQRDRPESEVRRLARSEEELREREIESEVAQLLGEGRAADIPVDDLRTSDTVPQPETSQINRRLGGVFERLSVTEPEVGTDVDGLLETGLATETLDGQFEFTARSELGQIEEQSELTRSELDIGRELAVEEALEFGSELDLGVESRTDVDTRVDTAQELQQRVESEERLETRQEVDVRGEVRREQRVEVRLESRGESRAEAMADTEGEFDMFAGGGFDPLATDEGEPGEDVLEPGWISETFAADITGGDVRRRPTQETLEEQPFAERLFGELPTQAELEDPEAFEEAEAFFEGDFGLDLGGDGDDEGGFPLL